MEKGRELARLNLVLELVSDFASLSSLEDVAGVVDARLRWILDFGRYELQLVRDGAMTVAAASPGNSLSTPTAECTSSASLIARALATRAPASSGTPVSAIAYPLGSAEHGLGVLYLTAAKDAFSFSDLRLLHHICSSLSAVLSRIDQQLVEMTLRASEDNLPSMNTRLEQRIVERTLARGRAWEVSPELLSVLNADGYFETTNPAWETALGWTEAELTSQGFRAFVHADDLVASLKAWDDVNEQRVPMVRLENRYRTRNGGWRWLSWVAVPEDGKVYCIARDITEEKTQQEALAHRTGERDVLAAVFQSTDLCMTVLDTDGRILAINEASTKVYWSTLGQRARVGDSLFEVLAAAPKPGTSELALWRRALAGEAFAVRQEAMDRAGNLLVHEMRFEVLSGPEGQQAGAFMTALDVTEQHRQQRALADAQEALRQSQKLEAIGQLTGGVAHDFNNVLAVIKSSIELLRRVQLSDERRERFMESIANAVTRGARITGQLLAFARRQALQPAVFDAGKNAQTIAEMVGSLTGAGVEIVTHVPDKAFLINADPSQFDTALVNLAVNARDAMQSNGTLTLEVRCVDEIPASGAHVRVPGDFVAISLRDTGTGIAPENLEKIFEPFFTTKGVGHGTGLGLSQVFGFVRQSGGDLRVDSTLGVGTTFTLYLPRAEQPASHSPQEAADDRLLSGDGLCILAVEDNPELGNMVESSLRELGYSTTLVPNAERALELLHEHPDRYAAVFSDVVLPGMSGVDLGRTLIERGIKVPIVLTSGYSYVLAQQPNHGFTLLSKPYALDDLARVLHNAVHRGEQSQRSMPGAGRLEIIQSAPESSVLADPRHGEHVERLRLAELASLRIMDSEDDALYDEFTQMAAAICEAPIALISLVGHERQWFKSRVGLQARETAREHAFCAYAIEQPERVMQVENASLDDRFAGNPLVTGEPGIRFYAGAPLVTSAGQAIGTLCVIDTAPRTLSLGQVNALRLLAARVTERLEARRSELGFE